MATKVFRGDAPAVAQVQTVSIGTPDPATTYRVTINGKNVSVSGVSGTNSDIAAALFAVLQSSTFPEFQEVTFSYTVGSAVITGTSAQAGRTFTMTVSVAGGGNGTISTNVTTASSGPNDLGIAANWTGGTLPTNGDDIFFTMPKDVLYNLDALNGIAPATVNLPSSFSSKAGLPDYNPSGYTEYRPTSIVFGGGAGTTTINIGDGDGKGSGFIRINMQSRQSVFNVRNTAAPSQGTGYPAVYLLGTNASNALNVAKGVVGVAYNAGEVSTIANIRTNFVNQQDSDAQVILGSGVSWTTLFMEGGKVSTNSDGTTVTINAGTHNYLGGNITTFVSRGGTVYDRSNGTTGTLTIYNGATYNLNQDIRTKTITNSVTIYKGGSYLDSAYRAAVPSFVIPDGSLEDVKLDQGPGRTYAVS